MVFASLEFLTLFLPVFFACYFLTPEKYRNHTMLFGSWLFYAWWTPKFLLLIIFLTIVTWLAAILIDKSESETFKTRAMATAIIINLASLAWYKYANVVFRSINDLFGNADHPLIVWETVFAHRPVVYRAACDLLSGGCASQSSACAIPFQLFRRLYRHVSASDCGADCALQGD